MSEVSAAARPCRTIVLLALALGGCAGGTPTAPPTTCPTCADPTLVPAAQAELDPAAPGAAIFPNPLVVPIPTDLPRLDPPVDFAVPVDALHASGDWIYVLRVERRATRSATTIGRLWHHGRPVVPAPGRILDTPFGRLERFPFHGWAQGWLPVPSAAAP